MMRNSIRLVLCVLLMAGAGRALAQAERIERLHEMAVELAWAADALTFPCKLTATFDDGRLRLVGEVPDPATHERVIQLAHHASTLPMDVRILIDPNHRLARQAPPTAKILSMAEDAIRIALPLEHPNVNLLVRRDGQALLRGVVSSRQSQWMATRALRDVPGIASVRNELQVGRIPSPALAKAPASMPMPPVTDKPSDDTPVIVPIRQVATLARPEVAASAIDLTAATVPYQASVEGPAVVTPVPAPTAVPTTIANPYPMPAATDVPTPVAPDAVAAPVPAPTQSKPITEIERIVRAKTGFRGEMEVTEGGGSKLEIHLSVATDAEAETLGKTILGLPEFANRELMVSARVLP